MTFAGEAKTVTRHWTQCLWAWRVLEEDKPIIGVSVTHLHKLGMQVSANCTLRSSQTPDISESKWPIVDVKWDEAQRASSSHRALNFKATSATTHP